MPQPVRHRRRRWTAFGIASIAVLAAYVFWNAGHGPIVRGKRLSVWLDDRYETAGGPWVLSNEATATMRSIGPDAIPTLLEWLRAPAGTHQRLTWTLHKGFPKRTWNPLFFNKNDDPTRAIYGFRALGVEARPAFPTLVELAVSSPVESTRGCAIDALTESDDSVASQLAAAVRAPDKLRRAQAAFAISCLRLNPEIVVPALVAAQDDPDSIVQSAVADAMRFMRRRWGDERIDQVIQNKNQERF